MMNGVDGGGHERGVSKTTYESGVASRINMLEGSASGPPMNSLPNLRSPLPSIPLVLLSVGSPFKSGARRSHPIFGERGAWDRFSRPGYVVHVEYRLALLCHFVRFFLAVRVGLIKIAAMNTPLAS